MILITGATGFLGRNLCEHLTKQGHQLRALARPTSDITTLKALNVEIIFGDITDPTAIQQAAQGCDTIIHAAAHFRFWGDSQPFYQTNITGTQHALEAALAAKVKRFIHISTIIVVGPKESKVVIREDTPCYPYPTDHYAQTKFLGEKLALSYERKGLPVIILRLGALYGPHGHYAFNRLFFEEFLRNLRMQVHQGEHLIFPCYVGGASRAVEAALMQGKPGEIYNISDESIPHREANRIVSRLAQRSSWRINIPAWLMLGFVQFTEFTSRFTRREPFYPQKLKPYVFNDWLVDSSKAQVALGFVQTSFEDGVQQTLDWYRSIGYI